MADLNSGKVATRAVVDAEKQIEKDLQDLLDTLKQSVEQFQQGNSKCKGCKGNKNKLLAELKVMRMLQIRVNEETMDADGTPGQCDAGTEQGDA